MENNEIRLFLQNLFTQISFDSCSMPLQDYLQQWLENVRKNIAPSTYTGYRQCINIMCEYFSQKNIFMNTLSAQDIQQFYDYEILLGKSAATVLHYHANLHKALKYAVKQGLIFSNPADYVDLPKRERFRGDYYSAEEVRTLLDICQHDDIRVCVYIAAYYGLRRSEIIGLKWSSVNFQSKTICIENKIVEIMGEDNHYYLEESNILKNSSSYRIFPLFPKIEKILREEQTRQTNNRKSAKNYNNSFSDYVCLRKSGNLITPNYFSSHFSKILEKNNLRKIRLHDLRHTCASMLLAEGASMKQVQEWLGHSDYSTTANIYCHLDFTAKRKSAELLSNVYDSK